MEAMVQFKDEKIDCSANSMEKYITFSVGKLQFVNSYQFMAASLHDLVSNLPKDNFSVMREYFNPNHVDSLLREGVYPYEYADDFLKFDETKLTAREHFFSSLSGELITEDEYAYENEIWATLQLKTLGDITLGDIYLFKSRRSFAL
ncbi:hypothetical protein AVEN_222538-1 [Araneus ventricosus]|uniref:Uncharacterized protein n=1 Tax=Araneus ventricosus TaxID=182803 RepID=A0A4Y2GX20_ARAVE|nr:hypothetical protein AVEN_222538-1 [Araneus ventricosus]